MEQNEGYVDMIINSLKYTLSDVGALFWGGVAALGSMLLIGLPFLCGYITQCGREVLRGNDRLPAWDNLGGKFGDGIVVLVIMIVYQLISGLLFVLAVPLVVIGAIFVNPFLVFAGILMLMPAIVIGAVVGLLMPAAWVEYAVTGDLARAINPVCALRLAAKNPLAYIGAVVATILIQIVMSIPAALVITVPWTSFATYASAAYIYAWFYRQTTATTPVIRAPSAAAAAI